MSKRIQQQLRSALLALCVVIMACALGVLHVRAGRHTGPTAAAPFAEFMVTNTNDSGAGSLRQAILDANANAGTDVISFNIAPGGVQTIAPLSALPFIIGSVTIDGTTQPGYSGAPLIELNGASAGSNSNGFEVRANGTTVRGVVINRFSLNGINFDANNCVVEGCYIGTDATGMMDLGNGLSGIRLHNGRTGLRVGGVTPEARNLISGNNEYGVVLAGGGGATIQGNIIGLNATGTNGLGNSLSGIWIVGFSAGNLIGGTAAGAGNLISGNNEDGVKVSATLFAPSVNTIQGNLIGTDVTGTLDRGNTRHGIAVSSNFLIVGGTTAAARNVIAGNNGDGIGVDPGTVTNQNGLTVQGNYIGVDINGTARLGNSGNGIYIAGGTPLIGGTAAGARNVISANGGNGIVIRSDGVTTPAVQGNFIGTDKDGAVTSLGNNLNGIKLGDAGLWANGVTIGGAAAAARNVIAGNNQNGVELAFSTINTSIKGNLIAQNTLNGVQATQVNGVNANIIGGTAAGEGNTITGNGENGVQVRNTINVAMRGNAIYDNTKLGIDLAPTLPGGTVTPNDGGDGDGGSNLLQNFPVLDALTQPCAVTGSLDSATNRSAYPVRIEFFANTSCDAAGNGEGEVYLGFVSLAAPGNFTFSFTPVAGKSVITATATDNDGNTSEFSACRTAPINQAPVIAPASVARGEGQPGANSTIANITDANQASNTLGITINGQAISPSPTVTVNGVTISNLAINAAGALTADVVAACGSTNANFALAATDNCGVTTSGALTVTVTPAPTPVVTTQPASQSACPGANATFTVAASNALGYQWRKNGANIAGATGATLTLNNVSTADAGGYDVVIAGFCSTSTTSGGATLTINTPVGIATQPTAQTVCSGGTANFSVTASGTGPYSYQWRKDGVALNGATGASFIIASATAADVAAYDVIVSGACGSPVTSASATLTVNVATTITAQPANQTVCAGSAATFSVTATGTALSYQWRKGGAPISGATGANFMIPAVTAGDAGNYDVMVSGACGSVISDAATLTVNAATAITTQPANQAVCLGSPATFSVTATGTALSYQWRKDGVSISGATSSSYAIAAVTAADAGNYDVVVTGVCGTVTSNAASLTINAATAINTQPANQTVCSGAPATFTVSASGSGTLSYQWRKNGAAISGATSSSFTIPATTTGEAGSYDVIVSGACGSMTSSAATLTVNTAPAIGTQPLSLTRCEGQAATFSVSATGAGLSYQWRKNGVNLAGASSSSYAIAAVAAGDAGSYDVVVTGACGSVTSTAAALTVNAPVAIATHPASLTRCEGQTATLSVSATGTSLSYQWRKNGSDIVGATSASFTIPSATAADAATYDVIVSGACGSPVISAPATLTINASTAISSQPLSQTVCVGASATFTVTATGTGLSYQWRKNGSNIAGATSSSFAIAAVSSSAAGSYDVVVSGTCGSLTSNAASLTVNLPPSLTTQPANQTVNVGASVSFSVTATGTGPFSYQWRKNGLNIASATGSSYSIAAATTSDAGSYDVVVNGACSPAATSNAAALTVNQTSAGCVRSHGYWKNHAEAWPVNTLVLGSQTYNKPELLALLAAPVKGDASISLAHQHIAAKLNLASGAAATAIATTVQAADNWLSQFSGKLPYGVKSSSSPGQTAVNLAGTLDRYNNGTLAGGPPYCGSGSGPTPSVTRAVRNDFDGDGKSDLVTWRAAEGHWLIAYSSGGTSDEQWGERTDVLVAEDYDGDGQSDIAVWRPLDGVWYVLNSSNGVINNRQWGQRGDVPVPGDYDGDGKTDLAVWRGAETNWYIRRSSDGQSQISSWGSSDPAYNDVPVQADYDGDGKTDIAVFRRATGTWYIRNSSNDQFQIVHWGLSTDTPTPGDYDGDGKTDIAVWRGANSNWYIRRSADGQFQITSWGTSAAPYNDVAVPGDYDGDGKTDVAVWRPALGTWFVRQSTDGAAQIRQHGQNGDTPVPAVRR